MTTSKFWLIRHGETKWNSEMRLQGWRDIALNEAGILQAQHLARHLASDKFNVKIDAVISSDLARAYQTAELATEHLKLPVLKTPSLRERNYGIYEGHQLVFNQSQRAGLPEFDLRDPNAHLENGEKLSVFYDRIKLAFEELASAHQGQNVMVFAHGGVIDIVWRLSQQFGLDVFRAEPILNTSINEFKINVANNSWNMINWGQVNHLTPASTTPSALP